MHLTASDLDLYLARGLDRGERARVELHLDECPRCALAMETAALEPERWERRGILGRLVPVVPPPEAVAVDADHAERMRRAA